jgi:hypothetical protein
LNPVVLVVRFVSKKSRATVEIENDNVKLAIVIQIVHTNAPAHLDDFHSWPAVVGDINESLLRCTAKK